MYLPTAINPGTIIIQNVRTRHSDKHSDKNTTVYVNINTQRPMNKARSVTNVSSPMKKYFSDFMVDN
jgi:hypothetical protein